MVARFRKLPAPGADVKASADAARGGVRQNLQKYLTTWPSWLFARGDVAAGGAGDESPLEFSDRTLKADEKHRFNFIRGGRGGGGRGPAPPPGPAKVYLNVTSLNPKAAGKPVIIWRNPTVGIRPMGPGGRGFGQPAGARRRQPARGATAGSRSTACGSAAPARRAADGAASCRPDRGSRCVRW